LSSIIDYGAKILNVLKSENYLMVHGGFSIRSGVVSRHFVSDVNIICYICMILNINVSI